MPNRRLVNRLDAVVGVPDILCKVLSMSGAAAPSRHAVASVLLKDLVTAFENAIGDRTTFIKLLENGLMRLVVEIMLDFYHTQKAERTPGIIRELYRPLEDEPGVSSALSPPSDHELTARLGSLLVDCLSNHLYVIVQNPLR